MLKRKVFLFSLLLLMTMFSSVAFATAPYASIIAFNQNGLIVDTYGKSNGKPNTNTLSTLDIINMTPWDISIGNVQSPSQILKNMTKTPLYPFWLTGVNGTGWKPGVASSNSFAFHSIQIPLADFVNKKSTWELDNSIDGYIYDTSYSSVPIVFNSRTGAQGGNTVALNFMPTSSAGFGVEASYSQTNSSRTLSFGDGTNSYGWLCMEVGGGTKNNKKINNSSVFLTIQALQGGNNWKAITKNLVPVTAYTGKGGSVPGTLVQAPKYLTASGLVYPNFSSVAGGNSSQSYDLVAILQVGDYADCTLLFMAVPHSNDGFLKGIQ
ncbi:MAG: hypothetical protein H6Q68_2616 [Firmicutes bacterium]|nr:hypothetical protein [Bacillota bacterium]